MRVNMNLTHTFCSNKKYLSIQVWRFCNNFSDVLGLWPFTLDEFIQALHDYVSHLSGLQFLFSCENVFMNSVSGWIDSFPNIVYILLSKLVFTSLGFKAVG